MRRSERNFVVSFSTENSSSESNEMRKNFSDGQQPIFVEFRAKINPRH